MVPAVNAQVVHPAASTRARSRFGLAWGSRRPLPGSTAVVTDQQIRALVAAAQGLSRRERCAHVSTAAAAERLLRLDWAVRAGVLVLAARAARAATSTADAAPPPWAQP